MLEIDFNHSDEELRKILKTSRVVAMVSESNDHYYTSYQVAQYLKEMGDRVYPVNPRIKKVDGKRSYPSLADVPEPIDIVEVFRKPTSLDEIVDAAVAVGAKTLWAQLEVVSSNQEPERRAKAAGMNVVSNHCMRTEHERLQIPSRSKFARTSNRSSNSRAGSTRRGCRKESYEYTNRAGKYRRPHARIE